MKRRALKLTACFLAAGMTFTGTGSIAFASKDITLAGLGEITAPAGSTADSAEVEDTAAQEATSEEVQEETVAEQTEAVVDTSMSGQLAFAQCDEYINVRSSASADSEVVGKVYNNGSVTILSQVGDWYEVQSGNAVGYVKAEYFATGEQAEAIAQEVAYNVATVYPEALVIRSEASEDSESIGMAYSSDELEVVAYEGDWMKVALGGDTYGYVNAYYVGYDTYYATAETLEEEQARLDQEWLDYLAEQEAEQAAAEQAWLDYLAEQEAEQQTWDTEYEYQAPVETTPTVTETVTTTDAQATANALYQAYLEAQAAADQATTQGDEQAVYDTAAAAQEAYQRYLEAQAIADQQYYQTQDTTTTYEEPTYTYEEPTYEDTYYEEPTYEETYEEPTYEETYEEPVYEETNSLGQQIVNYATQFVGNPYVYGGTSLTNGADCSGFTQSVFANFGISLPRTAAAQSGSGTAVDLSNIQAGDLLFYSDGSGISHVSIYMGNGQVVHASSSTTGIIISDVGYRTPVCARRYY